MSTKQQKAKLHQIGINYSQEHDRLMLLIKMDDFSEIRAWVTRRYLIKLWEVLIQSIRTYVDKDLPQQQAAPVKDAMLAFKHEKHVQQENFKQKFEEKVTNTPLGKDPLLLTKMTLKPGPNQMQILGLYPNNGQGLELALNEPLMHSLCKLLQEGQQKAGWGLSLVVPGQDATAGSVDSSRLN